MSEATGPLPALRPETLEDRIEAQDDLLARNGRELAALRRELARAISSRGPLTELMVGWHRLAEVEAELRETREQRDREVRLRTVEEVREEARRAALAAVPAPPSRRRTSRRRDGDRPLMLAVPPEGGAAPGAVIPLIAAAAGLAHKLAAHKAVAAAVAAVVLGTGAAGTAAVAVRAAHPSGHRAPALAAAIPGWATLATPIAVAVTAPGRRRRQDGTDADGAGRLRAPRPSASPSPSPSPSSSSSLPAAGILSAPASLRVGPAGTAVLVISAEGGAVSWAATSASPAVTLDGLASESGILQAGQSAEIVVSIDPAALVMPGSTVISLGEGGPAVAVSWV